MRRRSSRGRKTGRRSFSRRGRKMRRKVGRPIRIGYRM